MMTGQIIARMDKAMAEQLPAMEIAEEVNHLLAGEQCLVITAPPGAGKSTLLPLTILDSLPEGRILMLEPRRIAARQIAERMASMLGEPVGKTVGYRVRFESRVSAETRIEVLTEGILTRMLIDDQTLDGVSAVIFDEFHERSIHSDVALALTRESQAIIRPDLKIVIMSATIDADEICSKMGAKLIESKGRMFPVEVLHCPSDEDMPEAVAHAVRMVHGKYEGDILAFLPGEAEIRRCKEMLGECIGTTKVLPLYGMLSSAEQKTAIAPSAPGERKVVLATPIAETSITIEGVRIVVDSGLCKKMVFNPQNSLSHLETVRISMDMARQRTGRAGRTAPGVCIRLWSAATERTMADCRVPEILEADLAPMLLDISACGGDELPWLTPPPPAHLAAAHTLLTMLGALDEKGRITAHGRTLSKTPCHPRIAQMLLRGQKALASDIAAVLEERDPMPEAGAAISLRIDELRRHPGARNWSRIAKIAEQYRDIVKAKPDSSYTDAYAAGALIAAAYPERIGKTLGDGRFMLATGDIAFVDRTDEIAAYDWIAVASLNTRAGADGRIFLAAPLDPKDVETTTYDNVSWDSRKGAVVSQRETRIGRLVVDTRQISSDPAVTAHIICEAVQKEGLSMLDFDDEVENLQRRIAAVAAWHPELELPDSSTDALLRSAPEWLPFYIGKATTKAELKKIDLKAAIWARLSYEQQQSVERLAPTHIAVPTGSRIRVEYRLGAEAPVLRVRLQECFGLLDTPRVDGGARPVLMELLSPGFKPVQLTSDLRSFWEGTYFEVRKELKRRYPKHSWPDNPLEAEAVRGVKKNS
ncbi:MAG: ATP-dependent helicase HrpB [Bacteroidales bacterium]|nr:ATP-dependent helicase HrpB [Bacteroidales bacterium]